MNVLLKIYESLLNEKASLEKECYILSLDYAREFGDQIEVLFELKVDVVTLKKKLAFCVKKQYRNEEIYASDLEKYIDEEILDYQQRLSQLIEFNRHAKEDFGEEITYEESRKIKKLYYEIAHLIHPDLHPEFKDDGNVLELWNEAVTAYKCNDFKALAETYDKILIVVKKSEAFIENIEIKIDAIKEEIKEIKKNEPYKYKFILHDEIETIEHHKAIEKEINDYNEYKANLEQELSKFKVIEGYEN